MHRGDALFSECVPLMYQILKTIRYNYILFEIKLIIRDRLL